MPLRLIVEVMLQKFISAREEESDKLHRSAEFLLDM
jgi:hypothetical protein